MLLADFCLLGGEGCVGGSEGGLVATRVSCYGEDFGEGLGRLGGRRRKLGGLQMGSSIRCSRCIRCDKQGMRRAGEWR